MRPGQTPRTLARRNRRIRRSFTVPQRPIRQNWTWRLHCPRLTFLSHRIDLGILYRREFVAPGFRSAAFLYFLTALASHSNYLCHARQVALARFCSADVALPSDSAAFDSCFCNAMFLTRVVFAEILYAVAPAFSSHSKSAAYQVLKFSSTRPEF